MRTICYVHFVNKQNLQLPYLFRTVVSFVFTHFMNNINKIAVFHLVQLCCPPVEVLSLSFLNVYSYILVYNPKTCHGECVECYHDDNYQRYSASGHFVMGVVLPIFICIATVTNVRQLALSVIKYSTLCMLFTHCITLSVFFL